MKSLSYLILGTGNNDIIFQNKEDVERFKDYMKIYLKRNNNKLIAYCFKEKNAHILFKRKKERFNTFIDGAITAYEYYLKNKCNKDVNIQYKRRKVENKEYLINLIRFIHSNGYNSFDYYENYSRYRINDFIDANFLIEGLYDNTESSKDNFILETVREVAESYSIDFKRDEYFELDKISKRRKRARDFLENFLRKNEINFNELINKENIDLMKDLVSSYRSETDLSFRDIGFILDMSHTSVIRLFYDN